MMKTKGRQNLEGKVMTIVCIFEAYSEQKSKHIKSKETVEVFYCIRKMCFFCLITHLLIEYDRSFFATIFITYRNINRMEFDIGNSKTNSTSSNGRCCYSLWTKSGNPMWKVASSNIFVVIEEYFSLNNNPVCHLFNSSLLPICRTVTRYTL